MATVDDVILNQLEMAEQLRELRELTEQIHRAGKGFARTGQTATPEPVEEPAQPQPRRGLASSAR